MFHEAVTAIPQNHLRERATVYRDWSAALEDGHELEQALIRARSAARIDLQIEPVGVASAKDLGKVAGLNFMLHNLGESKTYITQAIHVWHGITPRGIDYAKCLAGSALIAEARGNLLETERLDLAALQETKLIAPTGVEMAILLTNLAALESTKGDYARAEEYLLQSVQLFSQLDSHNINKAKITSTWANLANIAGIRGDLQRSAEYDQRALALSRESGQTVTTVHVLNNLAITAIEQKDFQNAEDYLSEALNLERNDQESKPLLAITLRSLGVLRTKQSNPNAAEKAYIESLSYIDSTSGDQLERAVLQSDLGDLYFTRGQLSHAADLYQQAATIRQALIPNSILTAQSFGSLASCLAAQQSFARSAALYQQSLNILDSQVATLGGGRGAERRFRDAFSRFSLGYIRVLIELHDVNKAFEISERFHARTLVEMLHDERVNTNDSYTKQPPLSWLTSDVQRLLDKRSVLLEYSLGSPNSYLFVVTADNVSVFNLADRQIIEDLCRELYQHWTTRNTSTSRTEIAEADSRAHSTRDTLSRIILGSATPLILQADRILVVPDTAQNYLPFSALVLERGNQQIRLTEFAEVVNLPSAFVLKSLRQSKQIRDQLGTPRSAIVLADPVFSENDLRVHKTFNGNHQGDNATLSGKPTLQRLHASRAEARAIASSLRNSSVTELLDFDASRDAALAQLGKYSIIHFATHGFVDAKKPEASGLLLSLVNRDGTPRNGLLSIQDIYKLRLNANLVVLSACNSALGEESREGLVGLPRAFMYAGSQRVLASLWPIEDSATTEFMTLFYGYLAFGSSPAAALRQTQNQLAGQPQWAAPYYWAGFILQGEWQSFISTRTPGRK